MTKRGFKINDRFLSWEEQEKLDLTMTEVIKYCIHKTLINPEITIKEYRKRIF